MKIKKTFWIIGGGLLQVPLIKEVHQLGLNVIITDRNPHCVCKNLGEYFYPVDIFDLHKNIELLFNLLNSKIHLVGILAAGIDANVTAAVLARIAGLPGVAPQAAYITHNKAAFRKFLSKNNLPCPMWQEVSHEQDLKQAIQNIGFPLIIKNTDSSASRGTKKFFAPPSWEELKTAFQNAQEVSSTKTALVEELLIGSEQTVETIYDIKGTFWPCFITDRFFDENNIWAVEQGLRHPTTLSPRIRKDLYTLVKRTANKLGIKIGAAKADTMVTKKGNYILEMTTRLSGGFDCQYLVPAATGKNILKAAVLTALGKAFPQTLLQDHKHKVALTGSLWPKPGTVVKKITGVKKAQKMPGFENFFSGYKRGDVIQPYTDGTKRVCFIIASGAHEKDSQLNLNNILNTIRIQTSPSSSL